MNRKRIDDRRTGWGVPGRALLLLSCLAFGLTLALFDGTETTREGESRRTVPTAARPEGGVPEIAALPDRGASAPGLPAGDSRVPPALGGAPGAERADDSVEDGLLASATPLALHGRSVVRGAMPLDRNHPQVARAIEIQERNMDWMSHPGVIGTGVGLNAQGEVAIVIYAQAAAVGLPKVMEGLPVDVRRSDPFTAWGGVHTRDDVRPQAGETSNAVRWERPVPIGVSTGHPAITAGTIGCRVTAGGNLYALSNNHVYADGNGATVGDPVIQPGTYDGGASPADDIGVLADFQPIVFGGPPNKPKNLMDAAIALTTANAVGTGTPQTGGYGIPSSLTVLPALNMPVQKVGRTTGYTAGTVDAINATVTVSYGTGNAHFKNQVIIVPGSFSAGGDSGSLIVTGDANRNPVGLLFAGSDTHTIANEIDRVLARFGAAIDSSATSGNATPAVSITSPANGAVVASGGTVVLSGSAIDAEDGDLTAGLSWVSSLDGPLGIGGSLTLTLGNGVHTLTASATDSGGATGSASVSITVGTPQTATQVRVTSVTYATSGGRGGNKNLLITVALIDDLGSPVANASVSVQVDNTTTGGGATGTATTGSSGTATFTWMNAPAGQYTTAVTGVSATGLAWDGLTPPNGFTKP